MRSQEFYYFGKLYFLIFTIFSDFFGKGVEEFFIYVELVAIVLQEYAGCDYGKAFIAVVEWVKFVYEVEVAGGFLHVVGVEVAAGKCFLGDSDDAIEFFKIGLPVVGWRLFCFFKKFIECGTDDLEVFSCEVDYRHDALFVSQASQRFFIFMNHITSILPGRLFLSFAGAVSLKDFAEITNNDFHRYIVLYSLLR